MSRPRELSKIFSTATILATDEELSIIDLSGAINTASAAALAAANAYTDNATPDLTPAIQAASAAAVAYTDQELANIDLTNTIVTASTAAAGYADNLIINLSPIITGIAPDNISGTASTAIIVNGQNFKSGSIVKLLDTSGTELFTLSTTFNNARSLQFLTPALTASAGPYDIKVTNPDNQLSILENALNVGTTPTWVTSSGSLGNIFDIERTTKTFTLSATDADSNSLNYSIISGNLPTNMTLTSGGVIQGTTTGVASDTTYSFTVRVSDGINHSDRNFSITTKAPVIQSFTSTGTTNWTCPSGVTKVRTLVVAGGGGGGGDRSAGGGAGGMIDHPSFTVVPGTNYTVTVGAGGSGGATANAGTTGSDSIFSTLTAKGGGGGGTGYAFPTSGGSGGGGGWTTTYQTAGQATQGSQSGESGTYGYGFAGGNGGNNINAGGGGAGGAGSTATQNQRANGGIGRVSDITGSSVYYAGGGGGGQAFDGPNGQTTPYWYLQGLGGTGGGGNGGATNGQTGFAGTANTGGGGGGGANIPQANGEAGGSGIVIIRY